MGNLLLSSLTSLTSPTWERMGNSLYELCQHGHSSHEAVTQPWVVLLPSLLLSQLHPLLQMRQQVCTRVHGRGSAGEGRTKQTFVVNGGFGSTRLTAE